MKSETIVANRWQVRFERRRYGSLENQQWFTWASYRDLYLFPRGDWVDLGDPIPGRAWPQEELKRAILLSEAGRTGQISKEARDWLAEHDLEAEPPVWVQAEVEAAKATVMSGGIPNA